MNKKRIVYNMVSGLFYQGITFILAFLIPRLFLVNFGSEIKGMLSAITQVFSYLWLLEAGVGLATTQALYLPISQEDHQSINSIMAATNYYYKKTGYLYLFFVVLFFTGICLVFRSFVIAADDFWGCFYAGTSECNQLSVFVKVPSASGSRRKILYPE